MGNDFTRAERQREVLEAVMNKMISMGYSEIINMSDSLLKEVKTNINVWDYTGQLTDILLNTNSYCSNIISIQVPNSDYAEGDYIGGVFFFVPDTEKMKQDMIDNIYNK